VDGRFVLLEVAVPLALVFTPTDAHLFVPIHLLLFSHL